MTESLLTQVGRNIHLKTFNILSSILCCLTISGIPTSNYYIRTNFQENVLYVKVVYPTVLKTDRISTKDKYESIYLDICIIIYVYFIYKYTSI